MSREGAFETPVVFMIFNRPDNTRRVFEAIRALKPARLLVIADGPRANRPDEAVKCKETRAVVDQGVDWDCQVQRNYAEANLGCKRRISSGLTWAFEQVEEATILEDDCLPDPSFFPFCREMLAKYRHDSRIFSIAGTNFVPAADPGPYSYYYSRYPNIWGWATWRRVWQSHYDVAMSTWPEAGQAVLRSIDGDARHRLYWEYIFRRTYEGKVDTWDYQLFYASIAQFCLNVIPAVNLVSNIGFQSDATHTTTHNRFAELPRGPLAFPLRHPPFVLQDRDADGRLQASSFDLGLKGNIKHGGIKLLSRLAGKA